MRRHKFNFKHSHGELGVQISSSSMRIYISICNLNAPSPPITARLDLNFCLKKTALPGVQNLCKTRQRNSCYAVVVLETKTVLSFNLTLWISKEGIKSILVAI